MCGVILRRNLKFAHESRADGGAKTRGERNKVAAVLTHFLTQKSTGRMGWMAHRKWKKIKQQPSMLPGSAVPGSCLASFHFLWAIHPIRPVHH